MAGRIAVTHNATIQYETRKINQFCTDVMLHAHWLHGIRQGVKVV